MYVLNVATFLRPFAVKKDTPTYSLNHAAMLRNYFLVTFRSLNRKKFYTGINIVGLAIGMVAFMLIVTYVSKELSYDKFWPDYENIYRVTYEEYQHGELKDHHASNWIPVAPLAKQTFPEVQHATRFLKSSFWLPNYARWIDADNREIDINSNQYLWVDSSFMDVFSLPFIRGQADDFRAVGATVITRSKAVEIFGKDWETAPSGGKLNPIGKVFSIYSNVLEWVKDNSTATIVGVIEDFPDNAHFKADIIQHHLLFQPFGMEWGLGADELYTYVKVFPGTDISALQQKLSSINNHQALISQGYSFEFPLQALPRIHLYSHLENEFMPGGSPVIVYALIIVAALVLLLAWVNYVNLTTVQSMERAKEVGLRKVIGARRVELIQQFLLHTLVINTLSACLVFWLLKFLLPVFNQYLSTDLGLVLYRNGWPTPGLFWGLFGLVYLVGALLSGIYPALVLSSFKPAVALRGKLHAQHRFLGIRLRNSLMVFQFAISMLLIVGKLTVFRQTHFMQSQQLGFDMEKMVIIENSLATDSTLGAKMEVFRDQIKEHTSFTQAALSSTVPGNNNLVWRFGRVGTEDFKNYNCQLGDYEFMECYDIKLLAGRLFQEDRPNDYQTAIVNEAALKQLGYRTPEEALQANITDFVHPGKNVREIIGVVKNHHQSSLHISAEPIVFLLNKAIFHWKVPDREGSRPC